MDPAAKFPGTLPMAPVTPIEMAAKRLCFIRRDGPTAEVGLADVADSAMPGVPSEAGGPRPPREAPCQPLVCSLPRVPSPRPRCASPWTTWARTCSCTSCGRRTRRHGTCAAWRA